MTGARTADGIGGLYAKIANYWDSAMKACDNASRSAALRVSRNFAIRAAGGAVNCRFTIRSRESRRSFRDRHR